MHYIRNEIFMIIFSGMFLLCDMNANAQQIIKSSDTNDFRIGDSNDTYYIYDDLGLLRFVLSPSYQEEANLEKYGYEYRYDQRGRCVWKRLPGCEYLQLWYDNADNLMFSQDGEQRKKGIYVFYLYDFVKRQVLQGTTTAINSSCPSAIVAFNVSDAGICRSGYSSANDLGLKKEQLLQANYYDNHAFINGQLEKQATSQNLVSNQQASEQYSKGSLTGTVCMATDGKPLVSVYYHDLKGQVIASKQTLPDDALLSQNMTYSFTKQPLEIISEIFKNGISTTVTQTNSYNKHNDKIETMTLKVGNVTRTVSSYSYNDISRLLSIKRSGNVLRGYDFAYDGLNRLEESTYAEGAGMSQNKNRYSENILSYSPNGSIERLQRYGKKNNGTFGLIDDLMYSYNGNQIKAISDKAGSLLYDSSFDFKDGANADVEYFYDTNGALIKDLNKGISNIEYDILGNLKCISFSNGFKTKYVYDAAGNKLRTTHESAVTNTTDYIGNFIFEDGKLSKFLFDGGYCSFDNSQNPTFHYYEKDHLASVRMVVNENGTIEQVSHYYPFGGVYGDLSYNGEYQKSKYIGKEFDHMHGLDWYDHGARMYDAARVAWDKTERLYGKFNNWNLYCYGLDNPIKFIDKDGREPGDFFESPEKAALDFALFYNDNSIRDNKEFASSIYAVQNDNGDRGYTYTLPNVGQENHCIPSLPTLGSFLVAIVHTHGSATSSDGTIYANNEFSGSTMTRYGKKMPVTNLKNVTQKRTDIYQANYLKVDSYLATPNGSLLKYDYKRGKISVISTEIPSDVTDKTRKNDISTSENYEIDADALRRMIDKLLRLNTNSHLIFK